MTTIEKLKKLAEKLQLKAGALEDYPRDTNANVARASDLYQIADEIDNIVAEMDNEKPLLRVDSVAYLFWHKDTGSILTLNPPLMWGDTASEYAALGGPNADGKQFVVEIRAKGQG